MKSLSTRYQKNLPGGICLRSSCTLDRDPVIKAVVQFCRSLSDRPDEVERRPPSGWLTSSSLSSVDSACDVAATPVPRMGRMSITRPQVSTRWTVPSMTVGGCCCGVARPSIAVLVATAFGTAVVSGCRPPRETVPLPLSFNCGHGTLPRGMLL